MDKKHFKIVKWAMLFIVALIACTLNIEYIFGIVISFDLMIIALIIRLFSPKVSLLTVLLIQITAGVIGEFTPMDLVIIIEAICLIALNRRDQEPNLVNKDMMYWLSIGGIICFATQRMVYSEETFQFVVFMTVIRGLNHVMCVLVSDLIMTYLPWEKWLGRAEKTLYYFKLKYFLFHILMSVVSLIFVFNLYTMANSYEKSIMSDIEIMGERIKETIGKELNTWDKQEVNKLLLFGIAEGNKIGNLLENLTITQEFKYTLTNLKDQIIATNEENKYKKNEFDIGVVERAQQVSEHVQNIELQNKEGRYKEHINDLYFLYSDVIEDYSMKIYLKVPLLQYEERVISDYLGQLELLIGIYGLIGIVCFVINKLIFKPLESLANITTDLPRNIGLEAEVLWPRCYVYEVSMLINNFRSTLYKLKEMFQETNGLNQELSLQSEKLKESKKKLKQLVYFDPLTQIGNRRSFRKHIDHIQREKSELAVIFMDLDQFKHVNDTLGHDVGDELLERTSKRLEKLKKLGTQIFRLGGDEFVVTVETANKEVLDEVGQSILKMFQETFIIREHLLSMRCSIGVSMYPSDSEDMDTIIKYADMAMYECKKQGGGYVQLFNHNIRTSFEERALIEQNMRQGLLNNEFEMYYQPKVSFKENTIVSMEALIRWKHKEHGFISPGVFIPIAEEAGFITEIDRWTIFEVCRQNKAWQDEGKIKIPISINISPKHFSEQHFLRLVKDVLRETGIDPKYIMIEITEGSALENVEAVVETIGQLSSLGIGVSIDDFGRGYSSMNQLLTLPVSEIKIDKDFVQNIKGNEKKEIVVKALVELAHALGLNVVAEGIETEDELSYLLQLNCDEIQGYLISRPLSVRELDHFISGEYRINVK